jgi:pyruvate dehydrogenase E1 component
MPEGVEDGIVKGLYRFRLAPTKGKHRIQLLGSGSMMTSVLKAQEMLGEQFRVGADVWSATSYQQLRHEAISTERWNRHHPESKPRVPHVSKMLRRVSGPIIAVTDFVSALPDLVRPWIGQRFVSLGTDGYGRSDTRAALRRHFEVDAESIVIASLHALCQDGKITAGEVSGAIQKLGIDPEKPDPLYG